MAYGQDDYQDPRAKKRTVTPDAAGAYPAFSGSPGGVAPTPAPGGYSPDGGLTEAAPGAKHGTGYVNLQTYLGANRAGGEQMAQHVAGETARQGDAERSALAGLAAGQMVPGALAGQAQDTAARARLAGPGGGGLGAVLGQDYGGGQTPYTSGMQGFDAFLAGAAGGGVLAQSANQYGGLGDEVNKANQAAAGLIGAGPPAGAASQPGPAGYVASPGARGPGRMQVPAPYSPATYNPEQGEGSSVAARRRNRPIEGQAAWWQAPMRGGR